MITASFLLYSNWRAAIVLLWMNVIMYKEVASILDYWLKYGMVVDFVSRDLPKKIV